jgi:hypothetical protein
MARLSQLSLEGLRQSVRPEFTDMPADVLEQIVDSSIYGVPHDIAEDFMKTLGSLGKAVRPTLQRAAPGIAQGAATGASMGGPWGALIGAGAGLASSALSTSKPAPPAAPTVSPPASATTTPGTPAAHALPMGQGAAATLVASSWRTRLFVRGWRVKYWERAVASGLPRRRERVYRAAL